MILESGMTGATGNLYCGLHEFRDMGFLLHFLRPEDTFADIGANVGSFTVLASGHVGAKSLTFEPIPATYARLKRNIQANRIESLVSAYNAAMGGEDGTVQFTNTQDTKNHVSREGGPGTTSVPLLSLDTVTRTHSIPVLLKIDVEGFETEVVRGGGRTLSDNTVKAIIIELPGIGHRYGFDENKLHEDLLKLGFQTYQYDPMDRSFLPVEKFGAYNTLYLRDLEFVKQRVAKGPAFTVFGQQI